MSVSARKRYILYFVVLISILIFTKGVVAKDIETEPTLTIGLGYSDNINLDHDDVKSSAYTLIAPAVRFIKEGSRVKTQLDYKMNGYTYASDSDLNNTQHNLNALLKSELLAQSIFLDINANISQELLNNSQNSSPDGASGSNNLTQTYTYGVSPYWKKQWKNYATSEFKYEYNELIYSSEDEANNNNGGDNSRANQITLMIESGKNFNRYFWNFDYTYNTTDYEINNDTRSESYKLQLGYHYSKKLDFTFTTGYEDYSDSREESGGGWRTGILWNPTSRTNFEFELGHRFFGNTYVFDFKHQNRRLTWHFRYDDTITNTRNQIINNNQQENPDGITPPLSDFTVQYYLSRRFAGDISYRHKKSAFILGVFNEKRYFQDSNTLDEENTGFDFTWNLAVGRRMNMSSQMVWRRLKDNAGTSSQEQKSFRWSFNRYLSATLTGVISLSYSTNNADLITNDYTENALSIGLTKRF